MIKAEASPSAGFRKVYEVMIDPTPDRPETNISRMPEALTRAYVTEVVA